MKKFVYLFKGDSQKARVTGIIALALALVAIIMLAVSAYTTIYGPITEINAIKLIVPEEELDSLEDSADAVLDELEFAVEHADQEYIDAFEEEYGVSAEECLELMEDVSLGNLIKLFTILDEEQDVVEVFEVIVKAITIYAIVLGAFILLGAFFMKGGFAITSLILSLAYFFVFKGVVWLAIYAVVCIAFAIFAKIFKKAYSDHKVIEKYKASEAKKAAEAAYKAE